MLNQFVCVGRIVSDPQINETENGVKNTIITLAIPRTYKNIDGIYETDFISCMLWKGISENVVNYCQKGDLVGIKGRLQEKDNKIVVVAEKVSFLSSRKEDNGE